MMVTTGRSLKKRKYQEVLSGSSSVCSQNVHRSVSGGAWSRPSVARGAGGSDLPGPHQHGGQSQPGGPSQVENLVHENCRADSLFPRDHADTCVYFPETEAQTRPEVCSEHREYNYQPCNLEVFQNCSPSWRQTPQATEFNKTVLTEGLQH